MFSTYISLRTLGASLKWYLIGFNMGAILYTVRWLVLVKIFLTFVEITNK